MRRARNRASLLVTSVALLAGWGVSGCAADGGIPVPANEGGGGTPVPVTSLPPTGTPVVTGSQVVLDEHANGRTVKVTVGSTVELLLHFSFWDINGSSSPSVLAQAGAPTLLPQTPPTCAPEIGCSSLRATFTALRAGTSVLSASRNTCGEAIQCPPAKRRFQVTVIVTG